MTQDPDESGPRRSSGPSAMVSVSEALGAESAVALVDLIRDVARRHDLIVGLDDIATRGAAVNGVRVAAILFEDEFATLQIAALSDHEVASTELVSRLRTVSPIVDVWTRREPLIDLSPSPMRWPAAILDDLTRLGCVGVAVVPPAAPDTTDGVLLVLLDSDPGDAGIVALGVLADLVAIIIHQADPQPAREARLATLRKTLDERNTIEQAKGMLAERFGITPAVAWVHLRSRSSALSITIAEAATAVVDRSDLEAGIDRPQPGQHHD